MGLDWKELYEAAKSVQNERDISDYVSAGGVAAAIMTESGKFIQESVWIQAVHWEFAPRGMQFFICWLAVNTKSGKCLPLWEMAEQSLPAALAGN